MTYFLIGNGGYFDHCITNYRCTATDAQSHRRQYFTPRPAFPLDSFHHVLERSVEGCVVVPCIDLTAASTAISAARFSLRRTLPNINRQLARPLSTYPNDSVGAFMTTLLAP